jgi:MFS transporter, DHA1 family, multidrug resistance protein
MTDSSAAPAAAPGATPAHGASPPAWRGKRWSFALLLAGLGTLGPFAIDAYLPAFSAIATSVAATPAQMQQTLSSFLLGFAVMNLFHGALSDSFGRRPLVLAGLLLFTLSSVGCALAGSIGELIFWRVVQGLSAGSGMVISRAIIRDVYEPADAQRMMSLVTIFFALAPVVAPLLGGAMVGPLGWRSIFWMLAGLGVLLMLVHGLLLPETHRPAARQPFGVAHLLRAYLQLMRNPRFLALVAASSLPFNGMFLYILSAPAWLGEHLKMPPDQFFWFFLFSISGIMGGAWLSGRMAGRMRPRRQVRLGFILVGAISVLNVLLNLFFEPQAPWAFVPVALYALGWSLLTPVITVLVLDQVPERRGMASSVQASLSSFSQALVAGALVPLVMHSAQGLAWASLGLMLTGLWAWTWVKRRLH